MPRQADAVGGKGASRQYRMVDGSGIIRTCEKRSCLATLAVPVCAFLNVRAFGIYVLPNKVQEEEALNFTSFPILFEVKPLKNSIV